MGLSPYVKCVCPSCFNEIYIGECAIVSGKTTGKVLKKASKGLLARMRVEPLYGEGYVKQLARRQCYICDYLLPRNIELVPGLTLVVVGDTFSGKSHYIAALIQQIKADWMSNTSRYARFTCLTPEVEKTYIQDYFDPLFGRGKTIEPTQPATKAIQQKPLIYNLATAQSAKHPPMAVNLMIYDAAGEDFVNEDRLVEFAQFTLYTNAFIFVADPLMIPPIATQLPPYLQSPVSRKRAAEALNNIITVYEQFRGFSEGARFSDIPMAVMISKADLFTQIGLSGYTFMSNPSYGDDIDLKDIDQVDSEVRKLLKDYKQGDLLAATSRFSHVKYFATSATGTAPDASGTFTHVESCRCLDPMMWILHQLGIIV